MIKWYLCASIALCLSSCAVHKKVQLHEPAVVSDNIVNKPLNQKKFSIHEAERQEAALIDVPIPLYMERLPVTAHDHCGSQIVLGYYSAIEPDYLLDFYRNQMERQGWSLAKVFAGSEALLHFEKPTRTCSILIRSHTHTAFFSKKTGTDIIVYLEDSTFSW